uniref:Uncharacterized protein n=1 Tax=Oryza rufipogon TaxID=4529 RepID=A0A0E0P7K6_ORYRU
MEFYVQANILRSQGGIRQTIKAAYMTIWLDDFDSIVNSIWMKQGIIATILRSKGGIHQTIKIAYMNLCFDEFNSSTNSIRKEHEIQV